MPSISVHISDDDEDELEAVSEYLDEDKSTVIRKALSEGLSSLRRRIAIGRYQSGEISVNEAAQLADVSLAEWLDIAREHELTTQLIQKISNRTQPLCVSYDRESSQGSLLAH